MHEESRTSSSVRSRQNRILLDVIRSFKPQELSDLEACLNVIRSHASQIEGFRKSLSKIVADEEGQRQAIAATALAARS